MKEAVWSSMHIKATTLKQLWYKRGQRLVQTAFNGQRPLWYSQYKHIGRSVGLRCNEREAIAVYTYFNTLVLL
jgi:hypothetical protein